VMMAANCRLCVIKLQQIASKKDGIGFISISV
jgi:hypothetical protein